MSNLKYAYLGPAGTFSEEAISNYTDLYGGSLKPFNSIRNIVKSVINDRTDLGLLPLENSLEGSVNLSLDLLYQNSELRLLREIVLPINQHLLVQPGVKKEEIKEIYSHPQAISQAGDYLAEIFRKVKIIYTDSTAAAAKKALNSKNRAAVGSTRLAKIYDLEIMAENLQGDLPNSTRFILTAKKEKSFALENHLGIETGSDFKTSIICAPKVNKAGILYKMLGHFAKKNIDLSRIESRPSRKCLGEYIFYIDLKGSAVDKALKSALIEIQKMTSYYRLLGSYPKTVIK